MAARTSTPSAGSDVGAWLRAQEQKDLVRFVAIGSVDDGKSTLIGRLLHDAHGLYQDQLEAVRLASVRGSTRGAGSASDIDFSLFTDGLAAEREQGITIDVAYRYFATDERKFIIADTPGHVQYTRNMAQRVGLKSLHSIPVSALAGDNVVTPSTSMPWWTGGTMLDYLETVKVADAYRPRSFRLPVQIVLRPGIGYRGFAGQIASGSIATGDEVVVLPSGRRTRVVGVDVGGVDVGAASAPSSVALRLAENIDISRGDLLARPDDLPHSASEVDAELVWMSERPLDSHKTYLLKHTTRSVRAEIEVLQGSDPETLAPSPARGLALNDIGRVRVRCRAPIFFDAYRDNRATGAFIVIDSVTNDTVAAGMIVGLPSRGEDPAREAASDELRSQVSPAERRERLGHHGVVVRLLGATDDAARALALVVERELFDRGHVATVLEGTDAGPAATVEAASACARAGLVALVIGRTPAGVAAEVGEQRLTGDAATDDFVRKVTESVVAAAASA